MEPIAQIATFILQFIVLIVFFVMAYRLKKIRQAVAKTSDEIDLKKLMFIGKKEEAREIVYSHFYDTVMDLWIGGYDRTQIKKEVEKWHKEKFDAIGEAIPKVTEVI